MEISGSSPDAPCSACLLKLGLDDPRESYRRPTSGTTATSADHGDESAIPPDLAARFPQLEILHLVARGGMGDVYCARQRSLDRLVALKVIRPEAQASPGFADRFSREARALATLNHPNIVTVHDFGQADGGHYFIMEYIDGINLRQMLRAGKLHPRQALQIVPSICDALQYAHNKGIVHRDIKPENIMVDTAGRVKVADFGLAKLLDTTKAMPTLTRANQVMGTMHYMSPEQVERPLDVDHRADIYSLGVVIYELLTGELPLGRFAPPSERASLDERLDELVLQSLQKEPARRYQRISDLKSDMDSIGDSMASPNVPHGPTDDDVELNAYRPTASVEPKIESLPGPIPSGAFFAAILDVQSYRNLLYLVLSIPLGLLYCVFLVFGFSLGVTTAIVWVGLFVLLGTFLAVNGITRLERRLARGLLRTAIPPRALATDVGLNTNRTVLEKARDLMVSRESWAGVGYLLVKFPLALVTLVVISVLLTSSAAMIVLPFLDRSASANLAVGTWKFDTPSERVLTSLAGFVLLSVSLQLLNALAWVHASWARLCLKRSPR
ncbi:MAG: protein kinase [Planctomycetota bacterium]